MFDGHNVCICPAPAASQLCPCLKPLLHQAQLASSEFSNRFGQAGTNPVGTLCPEEAVQLSIQIPQKIFVHRSYQAKLSIHQFIFNHYKQQTDNNPSSMAIFEKKLRSIAGTIKDDFIKKYVLEFFLEKISSLTPHSNIGKTQFYKKKIKSLQTTQKYFNESKSLSGVELKEFSLLYLIMNNLDTFQENFHLIENIKLF